MFWPIAALILVLISSVSVYANPFLGKAQQKVVSSPAMAKRDSGSDPGKLLDGHPSLPPLPPPVPSSSPASQAAMSPSVVPPKVSVWKIVGRVGETVSLVSGNRSKTIENYSVLDDGCMVDYPSIVCNADAMAVSLRKKLDDAVRREREMQTAVETMRAEVKKQQESIEVARAEIRKVQGEKERVLAASPSWFPAGKGQVLRDKNLGTVLLVKDSGAVFLRVSVESAGKVDARLGARSVLREVRGGYAYYALAGFTAYVGDSDQHKAGGGNSVPIVSANAMAANAVKGDH